MDWKRIERIEGFDELARSIGRVAADLSFAHSAAAEAAQRWKDSFSPVVDRLNEQFKSLDVIALDVLAKTTFALNAVDKFIQQENERHRLSDSFREIREGAVGGQVLMTQRYEIGCFDDLKNIMGKIDFAPPSFVLPALPQPVPFKAKIIAAEVFDQLIKEVEEQRAGLSSDEELVVEYSHGGQRIYVTKIECVPPYFIKLYWVDEKLGVCSSIVNANAIALTFRKEKKGDNSKNSIGFKADD